MNNPEYSLFVLVPGFGGPHEQEKVRILENNLGILRKMQWAKLEIRVCVYDEGIMKAVPHYLRNDPCIRWIMEKGIVGQYIYKYATPEYVKENFDFALIVLDDIELQECVDFNKMIQIHDMFHLDLYSPSMTHDSKYQFKYMLHMPEQGNEHMRLLMKITCACEAFCYFIPNASYQKYWKHIEPETNPWIWGLDMCLYKCLHLRPGVINTMQMKHHYKNECYSQHPHINPYDGFLSVLDKYKVTKEELQDQRSVIYSVFEPSV